MKFTTTLILCIVLSGLGWYYYALERPGLLQAELKTAPILAFGERDSIFRLKLVNRTLKEETSLARLDSGWKIESPVFYPAEDFLVEGMVRALMLTQRIRPFEPAGREKGEDFGLDSPEIEVTVEPKQSLEKRTLLVGKESPVGIGFYARWKDEKEYFLIPREVKASLERSLYSLRQKKLFKFPAGEVTQMEVRVEQNRYRLSKKGDQWRWLEPASNQPIPAENASELIYAFQSLYVKEFLDRASIAKEEYGLQGSDFFLAIGNASKTERLILGAPAQGKDSVYTYREEEKMVLLISEQNLKTFLQTLEVTYQQLQPSDSGKSPKPAGQDSGKLAGVGKGSL